MSVARTLLLLACMTLGLGGCGSEEPRAVGYCYRTLAAVDCYTTPEPRRQPLGLIAGPPVVVYGGPPAPRP